jgi:hypothetical protein
MPLALLTLLAKASAGLVSPIPTVSALTAGLLAKPVDVLALVSGFLPSQFHSPLICAMVWLPAPENFFQGHGVIK